MMQPSKNVKSWEEEMLWNEKKRAAWISFPSANKQEYLLIVRLNLKPNAEGRDQARLDMDLKDCVAF